MVTMGSRCACLGLASVLLLDTGCAATRGTAPEHDTASQRTTDTPHASAGAGAPDSGVAQASPDATNQQSAALFHFRAGDKIGYIDQTGKVVVPPRYESGGTDFSEGLVQVKERGKWGYIDARGQVAIPPRFDAADDFQAGLAPVLLDGGKWGYIDRTGTLVIPARFNDAVNFNEGLAAVSLDAVQEMHRTGVVLRGAFGFIDRSGAMVIKPRFDAVGTFHEGRAAVRIKERWGFIDRTGTEVVKTRYVIAAHYSEGFAVVSPELFQWVFIDRNGKTAFDVKTPSYGSAYTFSEGEAAVQIAKDSSMMGMLDAVSGYMDKRGKVRILDGVTHLGSFSEGLAAVQTNQVYGYVDHALKFVIQPQFEEAEPFKKGLARAKQNGIWGYIDPRGSWVFREQPAP